jgi:hypothetical protein
MSVVSVAAVREYMELNTPASSSKYSDETIGSNVRAAQGFLERKTGRVFEDTQATKKFTTNGQAFLAIPGLRSVSGSVQLQGTTLDADSTYYLIPDAQQTGVYTGIQFRAFGTGTYGGPWWLSNPQWFDRNLDHPHYPANRGYSTTSLPNDLVIDGSWGWTDAQMPEAVRHAVKVLAAWYTKRPDALLAGGLSTPGGDVVDMSQVPVEVQLFVADWRASSMAADIG